MPRVSVCIPTLDRGDCLRDCLESLWSQSYQDFEIVKVTEEGELAKIRNKAAKQSRGEFLVFIDDDVVCSPGWLQSIVDTFDSRRDVAGVSGPSTIHKLYKRNRDLFNWRFKWIYDLTFLDGRGHLPGHFTRSGAWTTGASEPDCSYEGEVEFLEACNSAYRADIFHNAGGFDERFRGVGDWSEPDLSFRIRRAGHKLWFSRDAKLEHRPSKSGAFKKRGKDAPNRMANYLLFSERWIEPCWQHTMYKKFMEIYYGIKTSTSK